MNTEPSTDVAEPVCTMVVTVLAFLIISVLQKNLKLNLIRADSAEFTKQRSLKNDTTGSIEPN